MTHTMKRTEPNRRRGRGAAGPIAATVDGDVTSAADEPTGHGTNAGTIIGSSPGTVTERFDLGPSEPTDVISRRTERRAVSDCGSIDTE